MQKASHMTLLKRDQLPQIQIEDLRAGPHSAALWLLGPGTAKGIQMVSRVTGFSCILATRRHHWCEQVPFWQAASKESKLLTKTNCFDQG